MKVLLIEDSAEKGAAVRAALQTGLMGGAALETETALDLSNAVRKITATQYDLIVLDLMIPYVSGGNAVAGAGLELLRQIRAIDGLNKNSVVVGLSAYPSEVSSARDSFGRYGVLLVEYDEESGWADILCRLRDDVLVRSNPAQALDFIIMVALEEERAAMRRTELTLQGCAIRKGLNVEFVEIPGAVVRRGAIVLLRQMGLVAATLDTAVAIETFRPTVLCIVGICAGISGEVELGQIVLASPAWEYQAGKWTQNDFLIAPYQVPIRPGTRVIAEQALGRLKLENLEKDLALEVSRPSHRTRPIVAPGATGSAVIADEGRLSHIDKQHRKLAVLDMETFGVYSASYESSFHVLHYFSLKTVVDLADTSKSDDLHEYGCVVAARAAVEVIRAIFATS